MRIWSLLSVLTVVLISASHLAGLPQAKSLANGGTAPTFEVASIKPSTSHEDVFGSGCKGVDALAPPTIGRGRCRLSGMTLKRLVNIAYKTSSYNILGGLNWFDTAQKGSGSPELRDDASIC